MRLGSTPYLASIGAPIATQFSASRCEIGNLIFTGEAARAADALNGEGISFALTKEQRDKLTPDEIIDRVERRIRELAAEQGGLPS
jgi:hypothetical protein